MKTGKLLFLASLLFTWICSVPATAGGIPNGPDKSEPKDTTITKLDGSILLSGEFGDFSNLIPNETDELIADRLSCIESSIPLTFNPYVRNFVDYFTIRNRKYTRRMLERENLYFPLFEKYLAKHNMPTELKYLAVVESALNPTAKSWVGALGLWQFMPATGKDFRLVQNEYFDERMDPEKSTEAACKFLRQLHNMFGNWELALAAYNCGPGNVRKAIRKAGGVHDFWTIFPYLPKETRGYVPSFTAVMYAMNYADAHRISSDSILFAVLTDTLIINNGLDLAKFSCELNLETEALRSLNPALKKDYLPETVRNYPLKVPAEKRTMLAHYRSDIIARSRFVVPQPVQKQPEPVMLARQSDTAAAKITYVVKAGDNLSKIALAHNTTVSDLKTWNELKNNTINASQKLVIFKPGAVADTTAATALASAETKPAEEASPEVKVAKTTAKAPATKKMPKQKIIIHSVQPGDTLWNISRMYEGISVDEIKKKNNLKSNQLKPGQKLVIS
ncbi:MAG TPA: transglycosylase SLT domain-containing protein [Adhaeribacter sp.]|nr:transglycosylase SLT domain-containing protein [Adhaeribacter sp.]